MRSKKNVQQAYEMKHIKRVREMMFFQATICRVTTVDSQSEKKTINVQSQVQEGKV